MSDEIISDQVDDVLERVFLMDFPPIEPHWFTAKQYAQKLKEKGIIADSANIVKRLNHMAQKGILIRHDVGRFAYFEYTEPEENADPKL